MDVKPANGGVDEPNEAHVEEPASDSLPENEQMAYGSKGLSGVFSSPYVFGAAVLASLGGFSFGYGRSTCAPTTSGPTSYIVWPQIKVSSASSW